MSFFKGDSYFEAHVDDPEYHEISDEDCVESDVPRHLARKYRDWVEEYYDELTELFNRFKMDGKSTFGQAFFQLGTAREFCWIVFKYTQPGAAIKSNTCDE